MEKKKIAVLIPCYNEEKTIIKVIRDFKQALPEATIYVYDNNSTDRSYYLAKKEKCIVRKVLKRGKGNVVRKMFRDIDAECYLMVDADDTYSPKLSRKMCRSILNNEADMVIGDRLSTTYYQENKKRFHNFGNRLVCLLIRVLFKEKIPDVMSGYRAFSKDFIKNIPILSCHFELETEMTIYAIENHYQIKSIPVLYKDRKEGSTSKIKTIKDGISILKTIIDLYIENHPLKCYTTVSSLLLLVAIILYNLKYKFYKICVLLSILFTTLGIILHNLLKKYKRILELKKGKK